MKAKKRDPALRAKRKHNHLSPGCWLVMRRCAWIDWKLFDNIDDLGTERQ
jgi:hypothetical protein